MRSVFRSTVTGLSPLLFLCLGLVLLCAVAAVTATAAAAGAPVVDHVPQLPLCIEWFDAATGHSDGIASGVRTVATASLGFLGFTRWMPQFEEPNDNGSGTGDGPKGLTREEIEAIVSKKADGDIQKLVSYTVEQVVARARAESERDTAKAQLKTATDKVPEGARVVSAEDAKHLDAILGQHETLEKAAGALKAGTEAAQKLARREREDLLGSVEGLNAKAFNLLEGFKDLPVEAEGEGDQRKVYAVVDGKKVPLLDHVNAQDDAVKGILLSGSASSGTPAHKPASTGGSYVQQRSASSQGGGGDPDDLVGAFLAKQAAAVNPQPPAKA